jgi:hypothetical protein
MFNTLQILTTLLVAVAMAMALAHALELPGKLRLTKEAYLAIQPIYYPGFAIGGGVGEFGGLIATIALLLFTPFGSLTFWLTFIALFGLIGMQTVYWLWIHPVNQFWLEGETLNKAGSRFFSFGLNQEQRSGEPWMNLRNQWEYAHVVRAGFALISLIAMMIALSMH